MIRSAARTAIREHMDAVGSLRWSDTEINRAMGQRQLAWWRNILDANPTYTFFTTTPVTDANGRVPTAQVSGAADAQYRLYRLIGMLRDGIPLQESRYSDLKTATIYGADLRAYYRIGTEFQILPARIGDTITMQWNGVPVRADSLSTDAAEVVFPTDWDDVYLLDAASHLLSKAGAESNATGDLKALVRDMGAEMIASISRNTTNPPSWRYGDDGLSWGSN